MAGRSAFSVKASGALQAMARPFYAGSGRRAIRGAATVVDLGMADAGRGLAELAEGPYFVVAALLDAADLCAADASCRLLRTLNRAHVGPWRALGVRNFHGLELERDGLFEQVEAMEASGGCDAIGRKFARTDWKSRYRRFRADVPTFCGPFGGPEILAVAHADEVAYLRCRLCTDILHVGSSVGAYIEIEVLHNPDNLSMAVVDFEAGGCSSVTFSPDTGAVIRERKVCEAPRKAEGAYIQPLPAVPPNQRFHGRMGLYLYQGRLAFFRRCVAVTDESAGVDAELGPWETTGFVSDLAWAEGRCLTPCIAFRDEGAYRVRIVCVGSEPPMHPAEPTANASDIAGASVGGPEAGTWSGFDWEEGTLPDGTGGA